MKTSLNNLDKLIDYCNSRAYQCKITYTQNKGIQVDIYTKYHNEEGVKHLYHSDSCKNSNKALKRALKWISKKDNFRNEK